jgi:hypothetical protein
MWLTQQQIVELCEVLKLWRKMLVACTHDPAPWSLLLRLLQFYKMLNRAFFEEIEIVKLWTYFMQCNVTKLNDLNVQYGAELILLDVISCHGCHGIYMDSWRNRRNEITASEAYQSSFTMQAISESKTVLICIKNIQNLNGRNSQDLRKFLVHQSSSEITSQKHLQGSEWQKVCFQMWVWCVRLILKNEKDTFLWTP